MSPGALTRPTDAPAFVVAGDTYLLLRPGERAPDDFRPVAVGEAIWLVEGWARDGMWHLLRRLAHIAGVAVATRGSDEAAVRALVEELRRYCSAAVLLRREHLRPIFDPAFPAVELQSLTAEPEPSVEDQDHWIEIRLVDEADQPLGGESYRIELPDGRVREGRTDEFGIVRLDPLHVAGRCRVDFPEVRDRLREAV